MLTNAKTIKFEYGQFKLLDCREQWEGQTSGMIYTGIIFFITFVIPFTALTFLYGSIGYKTFKHIQPGNSYSIKDKIYQRTKVKVKRKFY